MDIYKLKNLPSGLRNLKSKVDKLDIGKLETTPVDLSNAVKNGFVKETESNESVKKVNINTTDTSDISKRQIMLQQD